MKKLVILTSVLALGAISAMAQGTINANNSGLASNFIQNASINGGVAVLIGKPATAAGFAGVGPSSVTFALYGAQNGTALATLESSQSLLTTTLGPTGTLIPGTVAFGNPYTLPTAPGLYDGSVQDEFIVYASVTSGGNLYSAWSTEATGITPVTFGTSPQIFGTGNGLINSIILTSPEPSTIALGGLGAAALLLFRRRK
jgi:hypothetical protein